MANTYSQIYIQTVFAVKRRQSLIQPKWEAPLYKYITGIISGQNQKLIAINGMPDHIHLLISMNTSMTIADLVNEIKTSSNAFIKDNNWVRGKFEWQRGFGAFSYSKSQMDRVVKYIMNQKEHHKKQTFREEYIAFLKAFEIEYDEKYLFDFIDYLQVE